MSYYDKNYYPTPRTVIGQMLEPYKDRLKEMTILEPSAGMGAICDAMKWAGAKQKNIYCCEINDEMKATLTGKGYKVTHGDFLSYSGSHSFDLVVMNPPFDRGAEHLLKAWEVLRDGDIVCLLNKETLFNLNTQARRTLSELISKHGSAESIGAAFDTAERKTNVQVAMVRLTKQSDASTTRFEGMKATTAVGEIELESGESNGLERANYIKAVTRNYEMAVQTTAELYKAMKLFNLFVTPFLGEYGTPKAITAFFETSRKGGYSEAHNEFVDNLQGCAWAQVFERTSVRGMMTQKVREKFDTWRKDMGGCDLNEENIMFLFEAILQQRNQISEECIVEVFDALTYYSEKNRYTPETWKTNSAYMVCKKFILNYVVETNYSGGLNICYRSTDKLNDMDRAMCMVTGQRFDDIYTTADSIKNHLKGGLDKEGRPYTQESEFFKWQVYLKGSGHFTFKDEKLRMEFNRIACAKKGWRLPETEKFAGKNRRDKK